MFSVMYFANFPIIILCNLIYFIPIKTKRYLFNYFMYFNSKTFYKKFTFILYTLFLGILLNVHTQSMNSVLNLKISIM